MLITETRPSQKIIVTKGLCDQCKKELDLMGGPFAFSDKTGYPTFDGALYLRFSGGYNAYYDGPDVSILLCNDCSSLLCRVLPCIGKAIDDVDEEPYG